MLVSITARIAEILRRKATKRLRGPGNPQLVMGRRLEKLMKPAIILLICTACCFASDQQIVKLNIFDASEIDYLEKSQHDYILAKIDSIKTAECATPFLYELEIEEKYKFDILPCIRLFAIEDGRRHTGPKAPSDAYERFLFNKCDSTIYPFGTGHVRFSKFMHAYLPQIYRDGENSIKQLVALYLNTLNQDYDYFLVPSLTEFRKIWNDANTNRLRIIRKATKREIDSEIDKLGKVFHRFEILPEESYYEVRCTAWNNLDGSIEYWEFNISANAFEVMRRQTLLCKMGPYYEL